MSPQCFSHCDFDMTEALARRPLYAAPHRAPPMELPSNPGHAAAKVAALALTGTGTGTDSIEVSAAIETMAWRIGKLLDGGDHVFQELAAHAATLSALSQRWSVSALHAKNPDHGQKLNRMATGCHTAFVRTLIAIEELKAQR